MGVVFPYIQVALRFQLQRGVGVAPKSSNRERMEENLAVCEYYIKPLYFAPHLIGDFRKLIKIAKFNGREKNNGFTVY